MKTTPLIILGSARKHSDTQRTIETIFNGTPCHYVDLLDYNIANYDYTHNYPETDEFLKIADEMLKHDVIVFVTPVYWYAMSGLMKVFFDRLTDLITVRKELGRQLKGKLTFLLASGYDAEMPNGFDIPFRRTSEYFDMEYQESAYFCTKSQHAEKDLHMLTNSFNTKIREKCA